MNTGNTHPLIAISNADIGWVGATTIKPCFLCEHFEVRTIKERETDCYGHLQHFCVSPILPVKSGMETQACATCRGWTAKAKGARQ